VGTYFYRATGALVDTAGSGAGGETTEVFTVNGSWDLRWSYDCSPSATDLYPLAPSAKADSCYLIVAVKKFSDCEVSLGNQGINVHARKSQGAVHNQAGGTFYFVSCEIVVGSRLSITRTEVAYRSDDSLIRQSFSQRQPEPLRCRVRND